MGQALYRKYRSKKLSEVVGQEHITDTLLKAIKSGRLSHAYLFTGPKGVGKTSVARILAHEVNNLPYTDESIHMDIIEIDAASNRRIDEIRDLRDKVFIAPTSAKYKVYIIDEVHMLTREAFNALLKTLEEPPKHVIFILATTETHKLPETIVSRTQRFTFKPIKPTDAVKHLKMIAEKEKIDIDEPALDLLASHGRGSFRDAISLLDQVAGSGRKINQLEVQSMLGLAPQELISNLYQAVVSGEPKDINNQLETLQSAGIDAVQTARQLSSLVRQKIIEAQIDHTGLDWLEQLLSVSSSSSPQDFLEVVLYKVNQTLNSSGIKKEISRPAEAVTLDEPTLSIKPAKELTPDNETNKNEPKITKPNEVKTNGDSNLSWWPDLMEKVKQKNNTLYGVLRMAEPRLDKTTLHLSFAFKFHAKKIADTAVTSLLVGLIEELTGKKVELDVDYDEDMRPVGKVTPEAKASKEVPETVISVFGGGEVLD